MMPTTYTPCFALFKKAENDVTHLSGFMDVCGVRDGVVVFANGTQYWD